ncbi:hypothetical protein KAR91_25970 [Candidatus Pacearchaeota archaeon]|nr:hypothetical protein [Candidatus Pacearchaeota archaeon]
MKIEILILVVALLVGGACIDATFFEWAFKWKDQKRHTSSPERMNRAKGESMGTTFKVGDILENIHTGN